MELSTHTMQDLFAQLGLPNDEADIQSFVTAHRPLPAGQRLSEAPFWSPTQAQFLRSEMQGDADWAEMVDQLNAMLHD